MPSQRIITVLGATGAQGGGLARAILADRNGSFAVRAITRDIHSEKARALAAAGAEVVAGSIDDLASLKHAFAGAYGAYCVTFFWAHMSPEKETAEGHLMAEAARDAGVQHVIWSTFEDTRKFSPLNDPRMPTLGDRYKVPHFDAKADANRFFIDLGVPTTMLLTSFYWENLFGAGMAPKKASDGTLTITLPMGDKRLPGIASEDIGRCAYGIFKRGKDVIGQTIGVAGEHLTGAQMAASLGRALGREVRYQDISPDAYRRSGFAGAEDLGNMFQFKRDFETIYCAARDVTRSRALNPELQTFEQWLAVHKAQFPVS